MICCVISKLMFQWMCQVFEMVEKLLHQQFVCLHQKHQRILPSLWKRKWHQGNRWLPPVPCLIPVRQTCLVSPGATMAHTRVHHSHKTTVNGSWHLTAWPSLLLEKTIINVSAVLQSLKGRQWQATKHSKLNVSPLCEFKTNKWLDANSDLYLLAVNGFRTVIYKETINVIKLPTIHFVIPDVQELYIFSSIFLFFFHSLFCLFIFLNKTILIYLSCW